MTGQVHLEGLYIAGALNPFCLPSLRSVAKSRFPALSRSGNPTGGGRSIGGASSEQGRVEERRQYQW